MVIEAVLFDWGDTLMPYDAQADDEFVLARTEAGLAALGGRVDVAPEALARCFRELGADLSGDDVRIYAQASNWESEMLLFPHAQALLDALRARELKTAIVSNTSVPGWLLEAVLEKQGLASRIDAAVFSSDVGKRKPHPLIFQRALDELGVEAANALFVGDRVRQDVRGAHDAGMVTVQALWSRADEHPDGVEPDYEAYTMMDVLNVVRRLNGER